jgi:hypothetical protein
VRVQVGVAVALAVLLPGFGSNWSLWETVAGFAAGLVLVTVAVIVSVCGAPGDTVPTV